MEPVSEGERDAAHALGKRRYEHFIHQVAKKLRHAPTEAAPITNAAAEDSQRSLEGQPD